MTAVVAPSKTEPVISLRGVTKRFGGLRAVDGVDLDIARGEFLSLLGPSGCGKTTMLRMIGGFEDPEEGDILLDGTSVLGVPPHRRTVNTVFQAYALFPHMTVAENVAYGLRQRKVKKADMVRQVAEALALVRMEEYADRAPRKLSGGQQQRVAIARAIVNKPDVLLLDEPLSALDRKLREQMQVELKLLQRQVGITFVFVTHDQGEALVMSDRIVVMQDGQHRAGRHAPGRLRAPAARAFVAQFIGTQNFFDAVFHADGRLESDDAAFEVPAEATNGIYAGSLLQPRRAGRVDERLGTGATRPRQPRARHAGGHLVPRRRGPVRRDHRQGREIFARTPVSSAEKIEPGSKVWCSWSPESVRVFPREV